MNGSGENEEGKRKNKLNRIFTTETNKYPKERKTRFKNSSNRKR